MTRRYNTPHLVRGRSTYSQKGKGRVADRYGSFREGFQLTNDVIAGQKLWYPIKKGDKSWLMK